MSKPVIFVVAKNQAAAFSNAGHTDVHGKNLVLNMRV